MPLHSGDQYDYAMGASCSAYTLKDKALRGAGYQQVNLQWYTDTAARMKFQSVWVKLNH